MGGLVELFWLEMMFLGVILGSWWIWITILRFWELISEVYTVLCKEREKEGFANKMIDRYIFVYDGWRFGFFVCVCVCSQGNSLDLSLFFWNSLSLSHHLIIRRSLFYIYL